MRIGQGYDVHKLVQGRDLILGGVNIPYEKGLLGHSDADVLVHAVMDALLGACALGDIGHLFPDSDPAYAGADSLRLLDEVVSPLRQRGYRVGNVDATVLAKTGPLSGANAPESGLAAPGAGGRCQRQGHHRGGPWLYRHGRRHCRPCRLPGGEPSVTGEPDAPPVHTLH